MLVIQAAAAKIGKHHSPESGDTIEMIERPSGGFSVVMVDGQGSGRGAKTLSNMVTARAVTMLKDGARDGAVARAVHDYLYGYRNGQVSAALNILSVDFQARGIVMSRNNPLPYYIVDRNGVSSYNESSSPIGLMPQTKPVIDQHQLRDGMYLIAMTDGIAQAGAEYGADLDLANVLTALVATTPQPSAQDVADQILDLAIKADRNQPNDDMSVLVLAALAIDPKSHIRRQMISVPFEQSVER